MGDFIAYHLNVHNEEEKNRQCVYNVASRRVRVTIFVVEGKYVLRTLGMCL